MIDSRLHSHLFRFVNATRNHKHWAMNLIDALAETRSIHPDDAYRVYHETAGLPFDHRIQTALNSIPTIAHPSQR